jgi:hypothetical protein
MQPGSAVCSMYDSGTGFLTCGSVKHSATTPPRSIPPGADSTIARSGTDGAWSNDGFICELETGESGKRFKRAIREGNGEHLQIFRRCAVKAVVDLAGKNQVVAFVTADIQPVELIFLQGKAGDRQRLALVAGLFDPIIAGAGIIPAVTDLETTPSRPTAHACSNISRPSTSKLSLN